MLDLNVADFETVEVGDYDPLSKTISRSTCQIALKTQIFELFDAAIQDGYHDSVLTGLIFFLIKF
jgi:hypothetical protein